MFKIRPDESQPLPYLVIFHHIYVNVAIRVKVQFPNIDKRSIHDFPDHDKQSHYGL